MAQTVKIISDSTCDLSKELVEKYDITILPLHILLGEMVRCGIQKKDRTMLCLALAVCGYFLNLCWMDTLQTIKYAYLPIALFQVISREKWENMSDLQHKAVHRYIR